MCPYIVIDSVNQGSRGGCDFTKCSSEKDWNNGRRAFKKEISILKIDVSFFRQLKTYHFLKKFSKMQ